MLDHFNYLLTTYLQDFRAHSIFACCKTGIMKFILFLALTLLRSVFGKPIALNEIDYGKVRG